MHLYLATDLAPAHDDRLGPDDDERLQLERVPWQEAIDRAERGEIADAKSLIALLWLDRLTQPGAPPEPAAAEGPSIGEPVVRTSFAATLGETVRMAMAHARSSVWGPAAGIVLVILAIALGIGGSIPLALLLAVLGVLCVSGLYLVPFAVLGFRRGREIFATTTEFAAGPSGVSYRSPTAHSEVSWQRFSRIRETGAFFFLDSSVSSLYVPKRAFSPEQLSEFRRLMAEAGFGPDGRRR
jgi:hypothetical protein